MAISTYAELQTAIKNWLHRDDLTARIPDFITLAESYINDELRVRSMINSATVTPSQVNSYVDLPTGFLEPIAFVDGDGEELVQVHPEELADITGNGEPEYYAVTSRIEFECVASSALSYTMTYYKALDIITDSTNDVLTKHPNIYLYGSLIQAEPYLKNDHRVDIWHQLYTQAVRRANNRSQKNLKRLRSDYFSSRRFDITRGY